MWVKPLVGKAEKKAVQDLSAQVVDLSNRLCRNNLVLFNIPEGSEDNYDSCSDFVHDFLGSHMGIRNASTMEIEGSHRAPEARSSYGGKGPRPMHVAFFRYSDK